MLRKLRLIPDLLKQSTSHERSGMRRNFRNMGRKTPPNLLKTGW